MTWPNQVILLPRHRLVHHPARIWRADVGEGENTDDGQD